MKKVLATLGVIFFATLLSGCFHKSETVQEDSKKTLTVETEKKEKSENKSALKSAMEMMKSGDKLKCIYKVESEGEKMEAIAYVEGKKSRTEISTGEGRTFSIFDGETTYTWFEGQNTGIKMNLSCVEGMETEAEKEEPKEEEVQDVEDLFDGAIDIKCEKVSEIDFSAPSNVEFSDQCELLKKQTEMMKNIPDMPNY